MTTLAKNTLLAFQPNASPKEIQGGFLIVKMDVEGAEYQVLKEVAGSGVLCDYVQKGNRVVMIVEFHDKTITDPKERRREKMGYQRAIKTLEGCGVQFEKLLGRWA